MGQILNEMFLFYCYMESWIFFVGLVFIVLNFFAYTFKVNIIFSSKKRIKKYLMFPVKIVESVISVTFKAFPKISLVTLSVYG